MIFFKSYKSHTDSFLVSFLGMILLEGLIAWDFKSKPLRLVNILKGSVQQNLRAVNLESIVASPFKVPHEYRNVFPQRTAGKWTKNLTLIYNRLFWQLIFWNAEKMRSEKEKSLESVPLGGTTQYRIHSMLLPLLS